METPTQSSDDWDVEFDNLFGMFHYPGITGPSFNAIQIKQFTRNQITATEQRVAREIKKELELLIYYYRSTKSIHYELADGTEPMILLRDALSRVEQYIKSTE